MAIFQHPHLTRGIVKTPKGAFVISRGFVSAPDEIGESLGWRRVDIEAAAPPEPPAPTRRRRSPTRRPSAAVDRQ
jgi:hypothetical protein